MFKSLILSCGAYFSHADNQLSQHHLSNIQPISCGLPLDTFSINHIFIHERLTVSSLFCLICLCPSQYHGMVITYCSFIISLKTWKCKFRHLLFFSKGYLIILAFCSSIYNLESTCQVLLKKNAEIQIELNSIQRST